MAASVNVVYLLGHLGRDPELRYSQAGNPVTRFNLATNEYSKEGDRVEWHSVVVFGQSAENCCRYLHKGSCVHVEGSLRTRQWETQTGEKRYTTEIIARRVQFLEKGGDRRDSHDYYLGDEEYTYQDRPAQQSTQQAQHATPSEAQSQPMPDQCPF